MPSSLDPGDGDRISENLSQKTERQKNQKKKKSNQDLWQIHTFARNLCISKRLCVCVCVKGGMDSLLHGCVRLEVDSSCPLSLYIGTEFHIEPGAHRLARVADQ